MEFKPKINQLVSIILPTYKRYLYLYKALRSVLRQTYYFFEIIIVDDDPNSNLKPQIEKINDVRIRYFKNSCQKGAPYSRNLGAMEAKGEYLAFLDDDDEWLPEKLEKQMALFLKIDYSYGVVYCGYNYLYNDLIIERKNQYYKNNDVRKIALRRCPIGSPTPIIRKKVFFEVGLFDVSLPSCQDWDLWIRLSQKYKFFPLKEILALYRVHRNQISNDISKKICGREIILEKYFSDISKYHSILSYHYKRLGSLSSLSSKTKDKSLIFFKLSLHADFFNLGAWLHFILFCINKKFHHKIVMKFGITNIKGIEIVN